MVELVEPVFVLQKSAEDTLLRLISVSFVEVFRPNLVIAKEQKGRQARSIDCRPQRRSSAIT